MKWNESVWLWMLMINLTFCLSVIYFIKISSVLSTNTNDDECKGGEPNNCNGKRARAYGLPLGHAAHQDIGAQSKRTGKVKVKTTEDQDLSGPSPIITLDNQFPDKLNFICQITNTLQRDRFCYDNIDAYLLACADDTPPLQLVPFCLGYQHVCSKLTFPNEKWCSREYRRYRKFCTACKKYQCEELSKSYKIDLSCTCEPYSCLRDKVGTRTAVWCQRYELYCDRKKRKEESEMLVALLSGAVRVHKECMEYLNIAQTICIPFKPDFDHRRCIKFLFDCELISDFSPPSEHLSSTEITESDHKMEHGSEHHS